MSDFFFLIFKEANVSEALGAKLESIEGRRKQVYKNY